MPASRNNSISCGERFGGACTFIAAPSTRRAALPNKRSLRQGNWSYPFRYPIRNLVSAEVFGSFFLVEFFGSPFMIGGRSKNDRVLDPRPERTAPRRPAPGLLAKRCARRARSLLMPRTPRALDSRDSSAAAGDYTAHATVRSCAARRRVRGRPAR